MIKAITGLFTFLFIFSLVSLYAQAPNYSWTIKSGTGNNDFGGGIATDLAGNIYVLGVYSSASITLGQGSSTKSLASFGGKDLFLAKYSCDRSLLWAVRIGSSQDEGGYHNHFNVTVDTSNNVYLTSSFQGTCSFTSVSASTVTKTSAGAYDIFIAKYTAAGNLQWVMSAGGSSDDEGCDIICDSTGNIFTSGYFSSTAAFPSLIGSGTSFSSSGSSDAYIVKYSPAGQYLAGVKANGAAQELAWSLELDNAGNPLLTIAVFSGGNTTVTCGSSSFTNAGNWGGAIAKLDNNLSWQWVAGIGTANEDEAVKALVDDSNNVYIAFYTTGPGSVVSSNGPSFAFTTTAMDVVMAKLNPSGVIQWVNDIPGTGNQVVYSTQSNKRGKFFIGGAFQGNMTFGSGSNTQTITSNGGYDLWISGFDNKGNFQWARSTGSTGDDWCQKIAVDSANQVYFTGYFTNTVAFGNTSLSSSGAWDYFLSKLRIPKYQSISTTKTVLCSNDSTMLKLDTIRPANTYQWLKNNSAIPGATGTTYYATDSGQYKLIVLTSCGDRDTSNMLAITKTPVVSAGPDLTVCIGDTVQLQGQNVSGYSYSWSNATRLTSSTIYNPRAFPDTTTLFILTAINGSCTSIDTTKINAANCCITCTSANAINNGLVLCLPFNGNANDETPNGYNGTVYNAALTTDRFGNANKAYSFNGSNAEIELFKNLPDMNLFSISVWIKPATNPASNSYILWDGNSACGNDVAIAYYNNKISIRADRNGGTLTGLTGAGEINLPASIVNQWTHLVYLMSGSQAQLYLNGVLAATVARSGSGVGYHGTPTIGCYNDGNASPCGSPKSGFFNGAIDDIRLYNRVLTPAEIYNLYNSGTGYATPVVNAGADKSIILGDSVQLNAFVSGGVNYQWSPATGLSNTTILNPYAKPTTTTQYILYASNNNCPAYGGVDTVTVFVSNSSCLSCTSGGSINTGLIACYPFNNNANDETGNGHNGTVYGAAITTDRSANSNSAYNFNGTSDHITISAINMAGANKMTISAWIYPTDLTTKTYAEIVRQDNGYSASPDWLLSFQNNGTRLAFGLKTGGIYTELDINVTAAQYVNGWHHIVATYDGSNRYVYKDGVLIGSDAKTGNIGLTASVCTFGSECTAAQSQEFFKGKIDDIRFYNRGLNPGEVLSLYTSNVANHFANAGSDTTVCLGDSVRLNASGGTSFAWYPAQGLQDTTLQNPFVKPTTNTTYIVKATQGLCIDSDTINVTVVNVSINAGTDTSLCLGDSIRLNATGATNYKWIPGTKLSDTTIANPFASPTNTTAYIVKTSVGNCKAQDTVVVNVKKPAPFDAGLTRNICIGDTVHLWATPGALGYSWSPAGSLNNPILQSPVATPLATTLYTVTAQDITGCLVSDTVSIQVSTSVPAKILNNDTTICKGSPVNLVATGASNFLWTPAIGLSNPNISNPVAIPGASVQYIVEAYSSSTCKGYDTINITVLPIPAVTLNDTSVCAKSSFTLTAQTTSSPVKYLWNTGDTTQSVKINPVSTKLYIVKVSNAQCSNSDSALVTVNPLPVAAFDINPQKGKAPLLIQTNNKSTGATSYIWQFGDTAHTLGFATDTSFRYNDTGTYKVRLVAVSAQGCRDTAYSLVSVHDSLLIFIPNVFTPNNDGTNDTWDITFYDAADYHVMIFNRWGELLFKQDNSSGTNAVAWNGQFRGRDVPDGCYVFVVNYMILGRGRTEKAGVLTILR